MARKNGTERCVIRILLVNLCTTKNLLHCSMPVHKVSNFFSEINKFFSEKSSDAAISCLTQTLKGISMREKVLFGRQTRFNAMYSLEWVLSMLIIFPCLLVKNPFEYTKSLIGKLCGASKDVFYRFINNDIFDWRKIMNHITGQLWRKLSVRSDNSGQPVCLIIDDTDYPKRGNHAEKIGRIFSHVSHKMVLGFKSLVLALSDGKTQMVIDFELVGEPGKSGNHSMSQAELNGRFKKVRDQNSAAAKRIDNYVKSKIELLKEMVCRAIKNGYRFDYLLADSWFTCKEIIRFIKRRRIKCNYLGMIKMGEKSMRFSFSKNGERLSSKAIISKLSTKSKGMKYSRRLHCHYIVVNAYIEDTAVRLFYVRNSKHAPWCGILTTDTLLDFHKAYQIYAMRWSIEVIFKDCKQHLGLGKCQSRDFSAQIAHSTIAFLQYNILSTARRFSNYETIGGLFKDVCQDSMELTVCQRIWDIICEIANVIAETFDVGNDKAIEIIIKDSDKLSNISKLCNRLTAA